MKFKKKPVVIDAFQFYPTDNKNDWGPVHLGKAYCSIEDDGDYCAIHNRNHIKYHYVIDTLEGDEHIVTPGDWIIKGVKGETYPCKDDIFKMTYEPDNIRVV